MNRACIAILGCLITGTALSGQTGPSLTAAPTSLNFRVPQFQQATQTLQIGGTPGLSWTATVSTDSPDRWSFLVPSSGKTPAAVTVWVSTYLDPGTYKGAILIQAPGATPATVTVPVTLTVLTTPILDSANNSADYSTTLAQGSLFVMFGSNLGPSTLTSISAFPLPDTLAGTSVFFLPPGAPESAAVNCPMIYTSAGQVAAILPSTAPPGPGSISVSYNGVRSYPASIRVAKSSTGIFTAGSTGVGTGTFTTLSGSAVSTAASAKPGDILTLWATGLGPLSSPDNQLPTTFPNFPDVQLYVGGTQVTPAYAGRSGCCSGIDQVAFTVPAVADSCNIPVLLVSNGVASNPVTLPVNSTGGSCTNSGPALPPSVQTKLSAGQPVREAGFGVGAYSVLAGSHSPGLAAAVSRALGTQVTEAEVAHLVQVYHRGNQKAIRRAMLKYSAQLRRMSPDQRSALAHQLSQAQNGAGAIFETIANGSLAGALASSVLPPPGTCTILPSQKLRLRATTAPLDAGGSLSLTGAAGARTLKRTGPGQYSFVFDSSVSGLSTPAGTYVISGSGGKDVGPFTASMVTGNHPAFVNKGALGTVNRAQPLTVNWTGGSAGTYVLIGGNAPGFESSSQFACVEDATKSTFTIPAWILSTMNPAGGGRGTLVIGQHPLSNPISIPGIDLAYFLDASTDYVSTTFR